MMTMILAVLASTSTRATSRPARLAALIARVTSCWRNADGARAIHPPNNMRKAHNRQGQIYDDISRTWIIIFRPVEGSCPHLSPRFLNSEHRPQPFDFSPRLLERILDLLIA